MADVLNNWGAALDLEIRRGASFFFDLQLTLDDGTPLDITGATVAAQIKKSRTSKLPPMASFVCSVTDYVLGKVHFELSPEDTEALPVADCPDSCLSSCQWDAAMTDGAGTVIPLFYGSVDILAEVTQ